jgi:hypothetical protein
VAFLSTDSSTEIYIQNEVFLQESPSETHSSRTISEALLRLLENNGAKSGKLVILPSIMIMAKAFKSNHLKVHDAFQRIRRYGYDYSLKGMDQPVVFWYTDICNEEDA